ncbi:UDP-glucuronosyltransferase [Caenorhabditis elegans]|uniref:UDP-glucuronosyltransferase n=1 Tax=Caenorhabditis elegans TaxID=6239 RepID=Q18361_CAEEL|nr:UDP-glucuronosyltransferase [Caenorhabditis elegans]CAA92791.2 UDP-glucuronosyltransferase [Caenorhabditis elegans]|eukprot:NP_501680.2 UDP-glucuronosyltransferase [Caenorhabditis elegans]
MRKLLNIFILTSIISCVSSYKILLYSNLFGHSHVKVLAAAADILTDAGNNVTVLMPVFDNNLRNKTSLKSTKNTIFVEAGPNVEELMSDMRQFLANAWKEDTGNPITMMKAAQDMGTAFAEQCTKVISEPGLLEKLKAENYDLAITEPFDTCGYALFEAINIRAHVAILTANRFDHVTDVIGQPIASSYVPGTQSETGDRMTMGERLGNYFQFLVGSYFFSLIGDRDFEAAKSVVPITRSWREVLPEASFILTNQIPLLDFPAPTFDKIVPIGGLSVKTEKKNLKLDEKWSKILGIRKNNVFISFGSNAKSVDMPDEFKNSLADVFKSMPDTTFIWKYENTSDPIVNHLDNVHLGDWLPQNELLADPRLSVFVTHGGLGSVTELAMMGTPAVMIPLFADQGRNAQMLKRHGGAVVIEKNNLADTHFMKETLEKVIKDPKYLENSKRLAEMLTNQPTNPKETLIKYVEFAARFGKLPSLDNYGRHQSYIEYFFLDIIAILAVISLFSLYISYIILRAVIRKIFFSKCSEVKSKTE